MKNNNQKKIVTIILCIIFGFSIVFNIKSNPSKANFSNYQGNFEIDTPPNLRVADEYVIPEPISDHLWSPDGTKLAYIKPPVGQTWNCEIWIADKSPNSAQLINHQLIYTGACYGSLIDWKGDWLLIMIRFEEGTPSSYYGRSELWKIRTDGTDLTQITFTNTNGIRTTWSNPTYTNRGTVGYSGFIPGTNLVYFTAHNGNGWYKSYVCNDDGTDGWYHISNPDYAFSFGLSPTGNKLLWSHASYWNAPPTLRASNVDGSDSVTIKSFSERTSYIILADGNTIIWHYNDNIYAIDMDGSNERTVIDDSYVNLAWNYNPANGQELIIGSSRLDGNMHLFKMNVDGSDIVQLTDAGPYYDERPILSPDGQYISYLRLPYDFDKQSNPQPWPYDLVVKSLIPTPIISINSPDTDAFFNSIAPNYVITITGEYEAVWYTMDEGDTNITITELTGTIDQAEWDEVGDGVVNLRFYVNSTLGNSSYSEVSINKDAIVPIVAINSPLEYELFGKPPPSFDLSVVELNIDSMWYSLDGGSTNITFQELTGTINQNEWDKCGNGTVSINFYVKDEADNEGSAQVTIRKEATPPLITIISPNENELFHTIAPTFEIAIQETDLDTTWYKLDDNITKIFFTGLTGSINQTEWDQYGNASIVLKFYANDSYGFENFAQVMVHKDISAPIITINSPQQDEIFSSIAPAFDITVIDSQLDSMWYTIDNGLTIIPIFSTVGTIDQTEWNKKGGGNIPIRFYANDTLGNTAYSEVIIIKDVISPAISINSTYEFEVFGNGAPFFSLSIIEPNLDAMWYTLDGGTTNIGITSLSGTIDQAEWNKYGNGTVTIQFYASDLAGNIGVSQIIVHKDVSLPIITILSPVMSEFIGPNAPHFKLSIQEPNIDTMWYMLDYGATNIYFSDFTGVIDQLEWNKYGNGSVVIQFYVKDKGGNEAFSEVLINKDIYAPIITIETPELGDQILDYAPIFSITIQEPNIVDFWYSLDNGNTNFIITELTGVIDQDEWDALPNGPLTIRFYAKDQAGNIGVASVIVTKITTSTEPPPAIPGYDLIALIGVTSIFTIIIIKRKSKK